MIIRTTFMHNLTYTKKLLLHLHKSKFFLLVFSNRWSGDLGTSSVPLCLVDEVWRAIESLVSFMCTSNPSSYGFESNHIAMTWCLSYYTNQQRIPRFQKTIERALVYRQAFLNAHLWNRLEFLAAKGLDLPWTLEILTQYSSPWG